MKLRHMRVRTDRLIGLVTNWHDDLTEAHFLACDRQKDEAHSALDPAECDFVMATVSPDADTSWLVVPTPGIASMPLDGAEDWEANMPKFAVLVIRQENRAEMFEGFVSFQDALRFISGIVRHRPTRWPLVIDAEAAYFRAHGRPTGLEWPDERD